jgi:Calcineurin-like phosphoesterase
MLAITMPQPDRLLNTLRQAARAFRATPGRTGHLVRLPAGAELLVAGDMHGSVENFRLLLRRAELPARPERHLVFQEVVHGPFLYPLGGDKSHQLLDLVAALKCQFPDRVHFLLGNHELAQWRGQRVIKGNDNQNDLFLLGVDTAYGTWAPQVLAAYDELYAAADLAIVTANRVWLSHSLPTGRRLAAFDPSVLERDDLEPADLDTGGSVHSLVWGRDVSEANAVAFLERVDADWLVTGHVPCPDTGYLTPNSRQLILDAMATPACCCLFPTDRPIALAELVEGIVTL